MKALIGLGLRYATGYGFWQTDTAEVNLSTPKEGAV